MIPQIENSIIPETINLINYPNKTYGCTETQIVGKIDDLDAIKQAIQHILSIERYAYLIYDDNYGVELEKYIGQDYSFIEATIEDTLKEALAQDDRILDVTVTNIYKTLESHLLLNRNQFDLYSTLQTETTNENIITETDSAALVTNNTINLTTKANTQVEVVNVEFDVYCKQGIIHTEVKVNV